MKRIRVVLGALVFGALAITACRDVGPTAPATAMPFATMDSVMMDKGPGGSGVLPALLACAPLPEEHSRDWIGPEGGVLKIGPHSLLIPAGALKTRTRIDGHVKSEDVNRIDLQPHGLTFKKPVQLTMSYANCALLNRLIPKEIAYTTQTLQIIEMMPSADDILHKRVTGTLQHFSDYAVAW